MLFSSEAQLPAKLPDVETAPCLGKCVRIPAETSDTDIPPGLTAAAQTAKSAQHGGRLAAVRGPSPARQIPKHRGSGIRYLPAAKGICRTPFPVQPRLYAAALSVSIQHRLFPFRSRHCLRDPEAAPQSSKNQYQYTAILQEMQDAPATFPMPITKMPSCHTSPSRSPSGFAAALLSAVSSVRSHAVPLFPASRTDSRRQSEKSAFHAG